MSRFGPQLNEKRRKLISTGIRGVNDRERQQKRGSRGRDSLRRGFSLLLQSLIQIPDTRRRPKSAAVSTLSRYINPSPCPLFPIFILFPAPLSTFASLHSCIQGVPQSQPSACAAKSQVCGTAFQGCPLICKTTFHSEKTRSIIPLASSCRHGRKPSNSFGHTGLRASNAHILPVVRHIDHPDRLRRYLLRICARRKGPHVTTIPLDALLSVMPRVFP